MNKGQEKRKEGSLKEPAKTFKEKRVAKKDKTINKIIPEAHSGKAR